MAQGAPRLPTSSSSPLLFSLQVLVALSWCLVKLSAAAASPSGANSGADTTGLLCYTCMYHATTIEGQDHNQGDTNCQDKFYSDDVMEHKCKPSYACSKMFQLTADGYLLSRGCMGNCKEAVKEDGSYTKCCYTDLCNGAPHTLNHRLRWLQLTAAIILALLLTRRI